MGQILQDRYTIEAVLGQGGMGAVYQARDVSLQVPCVVKEMLLPAQANQTTSLAAQFQREARVLASLHHANLPRVSNFFIEQGSYYLVMDLIRGQSLDKLISANGLPEAMVLDYADQLLGVLEYIHGQGVLHRDIKPANVIIQPDGHAILVDFGLVKLISSGTPMTGTLLHGMGTPQYAPPEQFSGGTDQRSDIYSLGGLLYEALTGVKPNAALDRVAGTALVPPRRLKRVSNTVDRAIIKALDLKPANRFQTAEEFRAALKGARPMLASHDNTNRVLIGVAVACGAVLVGAIVLLLTQLPALLGTSPANTPSVVASATKAVAVIQTPPPGPSPLLVTMVTSEAGATGAPKVVSPTPTAILSPIQEPLVMDTAIAGRVKQLTLWKSGAVNQLAWSPDGRMLAGAGYKNMVIRLWDAGDGSVVRDLSGHTLAVRSAAFSPDGKYIVSGANDKTVRLWNVSDGSLINTLTGHTDQVVSVAFSPDGSMVASASDDHSVRLWKVADGSLVRVLRGHTKEVVSVAFSPDGDTIATGSLDNTARLWKMSTGSLLHVLKGHTNWVWALAYSPNSQTLATASTDNTVRLWNVLTGDMQTVYEGHSDFVLSVAFDPSGLMVASGGKDHSLQIWKSDDGAQLRKLIGHTDFVGSLAWSPDGKRLASTGADGVVIIWGALP